MQANLAQVLQDMGRDIAIPGVELAMNLLQELLADLKGNRKETGVIDVPVVPAKRLGRPPGVKNKGGNNGKGGNSGWPTDPQERRIEAKRRMAVAAAKRGEPIKMQGMHPSNPRHPGHDQWIARLRESQKRAWEKRGKKGQKALIAKMHAAKAAKRDNARAAVNELKETA